LKGAARRAHNIGELALFPESFWRAPLDPRKQNSDEKKTDGERREGKGLHINRTAGRYSHYCHPGRNASSGAFKGQMQGATDFVRQ
jgi:hypothetical protein